MVEFKTVTTLVNDRMKNKGFTDDDIAYVKRHLREKIESYQLKHFRFIYVDKQKLVIFPVSLKIEGVSVRLYAKDKELETIKKLSVTDIYIYDAAIAIREQLRKMEDTMPWPPQASNLTKDKIKTGDRLESSLNTVFSGEVAMSKSDKVWKLKLSFAQEIVYTVSRGRVSSPKSILFPYAIKSLSNSTELIKITNRLGHGVSCDLLEELETENAYPALGLQDNGLALPVSCLENTFLMLVADTIDLQEETLSGKCS